LREIGIGVNLPIKVKAENVGAIFLAQNDLFGVGTRHIDTSHHIIVSLEEGIINIDLLSQLRIIPISLRQLGDFRQPCDEIFIITR
jgi:hypothetical protein